MSTSTTLTASHIRSVILTTIREVASEHDKILPALDDDVPLFESGLDSLCIAVIAARLEDRLGVDPFAEADAELPVRLGDFIGLYSNAAP
jgi:acyl carrier protein